MASLERWAFWIFEKDDYGNYVIRNNCRREYGFDPEISDKIWEMVGDVGVPGKTSVWNDRSEGAMGLQGEAETNDVDIVDALTDLGRTTAAVRNLERDYVQFKSRTNERLDVIEGGREQ